MSKNKLLIITENTIIKLYIQHKSPKLTQAEICTLIIEDILAKLTKTNKPHPMKDLFLDKTNRGPFYELVHFVFSTVEDFINKNQTIKK